MPSHERRLPESYHEATEDTGFDGGSHPAGGTQSSRFGAFGHGPAFGCGVGLLAPIPQVDFLGPAAAGAAVRVVGGLNMARNCSNGFFGSGGVAGSGSGSGVGAGGERRSPMSYQLLTGFVGGFQPGGGVHSSREGSLGQGPLQHIARREAWQETERIGHESVFDQSSS